MAKDTRKCIEFTTLNERYKIVIDNEKIWYWEVIDKKYEHKTQYMREDVDKHRNSFEKVMYNFAKQNSNEFRVLYNELKQTDPKFFIIAKNVLKKIQNEYDF